MLRSRSHFVSGPLATLLLCGGLAACGGGGGGYADDASAPAAGNPGTSSAPTQSSGTSSAPVVATGGAASTPVAGAVGVADAVDTARALGASAAWSLDALPQPLAATPAAAGSGRVYHVDSAGGSDSNDGLSATATATSGPWRTLGRLMSATLAPGDRIELACGGTWRETLRLPGDGSAGSPVVVAQPAAGCSGSLPTIEGGVALDAASWTRYSGSIYKTALGAAPLQLLPASGVMTAAHFPSVGDVADPASPYLSLAAPSSGAVLTTGSDFALPAGAAIDANTHVHVRTNAYVIDDAAVSAFDGVRLTLAQAPSYPVASGWGYYLTGNLWMLRAPGEWFYDAAAHQLYAWMPDSAAPPASLAAGTLATGIDLHGRSHVVVEGVSVHGAGVGVDAHGTTDVVLRNLLVQDIADVGIDVAGSVQDVVEGSGVARTGGDAISGWGGALGAQLADASALTVRGNVVRDSGVRMAGDQVLSLPRRTLAAVFSGAGSVVSGNAIVNAGYIGILALADSRVEDNFVYGACSVQDDCGGIYVGGQGNASRIAGNTVVHARGYLPGQPPGARGTSAQGIYVDDEGSDVTIESNTVVDADDGIQMHDTRRVAVVGNRLFGNRRAQIWMQEDANDVDALGDLNGNRISGNEIAPTSATAVGIRMSTTFASTSAFATFDGNHYDDRASPVVVTDETASSGQALTFAGWRGTTGHGSSQPVDTAGTASSTGASAAYTVAGANLVPNGALQADLSGWSSWNATAPAGQATRAACSDGFCLQYVAGGSEGVLSSPGFALQQGQWYRLSIDVSAQTDGQLVPLIVRVGSGDYASVSDRGLGFTANRAWSRHSVVFQATQTVAGAGARVDIDGIAAGRSVAIARLELVPVAPSAAALVSGVMINASGAATSASCPFTGTQSALCTQLADLATAQAIAWPLPVAAYSAAVVFGRDASLVDSDGDGIPDAQDRCPATPAGAAVDAAGCPLGAD
jgi:hypothetical protein